jgi:hypothetical protein
VNEIQIDDPNIRSRRKPLRHRFSIRALMILILVFGLGFGWVLHGTRVQREAVAAIRLAGGTVYYDWEWGGDGPAWPARKSPWPKWLVDRAGPDYFGSVAAVWFDHMPFKIPDDALMAHVGSLRRLESLSMWTCEGVSDAGLAELSGLKRLKRLHLPGSRITDAGFAHLAGLTSLEALLISEAPITEAGLAHLTGLPRLKSLALNKTRVASLDPISRMYWLASLDLRGNPVDDAGLAPVASLVGLRWLVLEGTKATPAGVASLRAIRPVMNVAF